MALRGRAQLLVDVVVNLAMAMILMICGAWSVVLTRDYAIAPVVGKKTLGWWREAQIRFGLEASQGRRTRGKARGRVKVERPKM